MTKIYTQTNVGCSLEYFYLNWQYFLILVHTNITVTVDKPTVSPYQCLRIRMLLCWLVGRVTAKIKDASSPQKNFDCTTFPGQWVSGYYLVEVKTLLLSTICRTTFTCAVNMEGSGMLEGYIVTVWAVSAMDCCSGSYTSYIYTSADKPYHHPYSHIHNEVSPGLSWFSQSLRLWRSISDLLPSPSSRRHGGWQSPSPVTIDTSSNVITTVESKWKMVAHRLNYQTKADKLCNLMTVWNMRKRVSYRMVEYITGSFTFTTQTLNRDSFTNASPLSRFN